MKNLKNITAFLLIISCGNGLAGTMGEKMNTHLSKENLYIGIGAGGLFTKELLVTQNVTSGNIVSVSRHQDLWEGFVYLGYGHTFQNSLFLGVEINTIFPHRTFDLYSSGVTIIGPLYQNIISINDYLGVDLESGYRINSDLLIYARTGLAFRDISLNQPQNIPDSPSFFNSDNKLGGRFGAGVTYSLSENIATSLDYYYAYFPKFKSDWPLFDLQYRIKSSANHVGVSLLYTI